MVQIPTKPAALKHLAAYLVSEMQAGNIAEISGLDEATLTRAEMGRLEWALEEISRRLLKIGGQEPAE